MQRLSYLVLCVVASGNAAVCAADESSSSPVKTLLYSVADLVVEPKSAQAAELHRVCISQGHEIPDSMASAGENHRKAVQNNLTELKELIQTITVPTEWEDTGGSGRIAIHQVTRSLIVRQHHQGHQEISDLLQMLRRTKGLQVQMILEILGETEPEANANPVAVAPGDDAGTALPSSGAVLPVNATVSLPQDSKSLKQVVKELENADQLSMTAEQLAEFRHKIKDTSQSSELPPVLAQNGHCRSFGEFIFATPIVAPDRRHVEIHLGVPALLDVQGGIVRVADGETRLVTLQLDGETTYLLVTAKIQVAVEEEERISEASVQH